MEERQLDVRTLLPWMVLAAVLILGPYLIAWLATPPSMVFTGTLANHNDLAGYLSAIRQGSEGRWLYRFNFSPETWQPALMLPLYIGFGKVAGLFGGPVEWWFNLLRLPALITAFLGLLFWVRQVFPDRVQLQRIAWLLVVLGGGIGWLAWPISNYLSWPLNSFPDLQMPELTMTMIGINPPHYLLGFGLEAIAFGCVLRLRRSKTPWRWAIMGMVVSASVGLIYVYNSAVLVPVLGLYLLASTLRAREIQWGRWIYIGVMVVSLLPLLYYYGFWVNRDPAWATYVSSNPNRIPAPGVAGLLVGLGLLGLFAGIGLVRWLRREENWLVPLWLIGNLLVMYVPFVQYTGRLALGLMIPVGTLAAYGLVEVAIPWLEKTRFFELFARFTPTPSPTLLRSMMLLMGTSSLMASLLAAQNGLVRQEFPNYMVAKDREAAAWLAARTDASDVVLAAYPVGNYLPAIDDARVFVGQFFMTLHFEEKLAQMERFWASNTSTKWREQLIDEWCITYVYQGTYERQLMEGNVGVPGKVVYDQDGIVIYQVPNKPAMCSYPFG